MQELPFEQRQPLVDVAIGAASWTPGVRLPKGRWFCWASDGAPCSIRYRYGQETIGPLETLAATALSANHPHPGRDVYIQIQAAAGVKAYYFVIS